ncbi:MAG TPA: mandelate racemase/muconate lactonizing enzyme family protein [Solirubrobacterales bacterium]|jgi:L-alanine-DL-glutamate epimerase-like enolase superfamily enzyme|nr:mandelate racemase/muconate lactonizing enzyme family protein [Solirubrobacterales bacterium]
MATETSTAATIEGFAAHRVSLPIDPPQLSGGHRIASIDLNLVEAHAGEHTGVGYSFAFSPLEADSVQPLIRYLGEPLVGSPVTAVRTHWAQMWKRLGTFLGRSGPPMMALSAIDVALWDLHCRRLGRPLADVLGLPRLEVPLYGAGGFLSDTEEHVITEALSFRDAGFRAYKMRAGGPDLDEDVRRVYGVREAIGPEMKLMLDVNQAWDVNTTVRAMRDLEGARLHWLEEPLDAEDFEGLAEVRRRAPMAIAAGETVYGLAPLIRMLELGSVDVLQPDLMRCGGITGFLEIAAHARAAKVVVAAHLFTEISPHLMALSGAGNMTEYLPGWFDPLFDGAPDPSHGVVRAGDAPGLGLSLAADLGSDRLRGTVRF